MSKKTESAMRLNRFIALYTEHSRRKADELIAAGKVSINRKTAYEGMQVTDADTVIVSGERVVPLPQKHVVVLLYKPLGYVCSKDGQGSPTVFDLLPDRFSSLLIAGRLDKDSSGLVVLSNDGTLINTLSHPRHDKEKIYRVTIHKPLADGHIATFATGVDIGDDRKSKLEVLPTDEPLCYEVRMHEGRNRQIRRSFEALGYQIKALHRTHLGKYALAPLSPKQFKIIEQE